MKFNNMKVLKNIFIISFVMMFFISIGVSTYHLVIYLRTNTETVKDNTNEYQEETELDKTYKLLKEIEQYYKSSYIGDMNTEDLELNLANIMIKSFGDKYGMYLTPELAKEENDKINNILYGIGILVRAEINDNTSSLYVIDSYNESSAKENGIVSGCQIIEVNNKKLDFNTWKYEDVINEIKGDIGTKINITFIDNNGKTINKDIERRKLKVETIKYNILQDNTGYIQIREFDRETDEDFKVALDYMKEHNVKNVIYDLRGNTGGLLDTVVNMLDNLLPDVTFLYIQDSNNNILETYKSDSNMYKFNSICIIDSETASASELFAQTLKENGNCKVVGETSFGKGTVCNIVELSNGGTLQISTFKYLTISKNCVEGIGVIPDVEMKLSEEKESILYKLNIKDDDIIQNSIKLLNNK